MASPASPAQDTRSVHLRLGALDLLLVFAGITGWSAIDSFEPRILSVAMVLRWVAVQLHLRRLLAPVRRWQELGERATADQLLAADDALQQGMLRFGGAYAAGWVLASGLAFGLTAAQPSLGLTPARAEYLIVFMGLLVVLCLAYAYILPLLLSSTHELAFTLARDMRVRGLEPQREPRSFAAILRNFTMAFTAGMMILAYGLAGKGRIDGERSRTMAEQSGRLAQAAVELARDGEFAASAEGQAPIELVSSAELPAVLGSSSGVEQLMGFDPGHEEVVAALAVGEDQWLLTRGTPDEGLGIFAGLMAALTLSLGVVGHLSASGIAKTLTGPLDQVRVLARRMVEVGDLRQVDRPEALHNDEVGNLIDDLNHMLDSLEKLAEAAEAVAVGSLGVDIEDPGELQEAFRVMLRQLSNIVARLRETALEVSSASAELNVSMHAQEEGARRMATDVDRSAAKLGSLAGSARRISDAADQVLHFAEQSLANVDLLADRNAALNAEAAGITELVERIREIADRSDLLALNGALEATRAGEGGRGFGLVAGEMRRLAERVTLTAVDVRTRITDIEAAGAATIRATEQSRELAEATAQAAREIATLTRMQTADTHEVSATITDMAAFVRESSAGTTQIRATAQGLIAHVDELDKLTGSFELAR